MLIEGEKNPSEMAAKFKFTMPALSTHLKILRNAGLIVERRAGQRRLYSLNADGMDVVVQVRGCILGVPSAQPEALLQGQGETRGLAALRIVNNIICKLRLSILSLKYGLL